mmetsp:Transcript_55400/g.130011  ORF Transcript_55400/g.130011 Transcript_55400/m.130011 type:complete len:231 (-) Transcript_55400:101-793(-)
MPNATAVRRRTTATGMPAGGPHEAARKRPSVRASARASALASVHVSLAGVHRTAAMPSATVARRTVPGNRVDSRADVRRTAATESVNAADRQIGPESLGEDLLLAVMPSAIEAERTAATGMTGRGHVATEGEAEAERWDEVAKVVARAFRTFASSMLLTSAAKVTDVKRDTPTIVSAGCFETGWKTPHASSARTALARTASLSTLRATGSLAAVTATVTATKKKRGRSSS